MQELAMLSNYHKALLAMQDLSYGELEQLERDIAETKHEMDMGDPEAYKEWCSGSEHQSKAFYGGHDWEIKEGYDE
jgi:hypothetical protein